MEDRAIFHYILPAIPELKPMTKKIPQFAGHTTFDDRGRNEFIVPSPHCHWQNACAGAGRSGTQVKIQIGRRRSDAV